MQVSEKCFPEMQVSGKMFSGNASVHEDINRKRGPRFKSRLSEHRTQIRVKGNNDDNFKNRNT